ncbi:MAG: LysM domain-containing protein [Chloroflexota bacterium]|nr:LysM domain-containing protein [Chloroflexota bacterium]
MKRKTILLTLWLLFLCSIILILSVTKTVKADSPFQASFQTPTPNVDGEIIYTVKDGDTCTSIYLLFQNRVPIEQLIALNGLDEDCTLVVSQQLIIATVAPATATLVGFVPTATIGPPTPVPFDGNAELCVVLFEDLDGNQMRSETESYLSGGVISVNDRGGTYSETKETIGGDPEVVEPACFEDVPEGEYNLSMGIPEGYYATTSLNMALSVSAGDTIVVDFGAQPASQGTGSELSPEDNGRSPLLLVIGILFLAGGAGLTFFFIRFRKQS